jgi:hypothetical protein
VHLYNTIGGQGAESRNGFPLVSENVGISQKIVTVERSRAAPRLSAEGEGSRISNEVGILGFACKLAVSYNCGRIGTTLIPENSKPTATWGRKAMGQNCLFPATAMLVAKVPEGIPS